MRPGFPRAVNRLAIGQLAKNPHKEIPPLGHVLNAALIVTAHTDLSSAFSGLHGLKGPYGVGVWFAQFGISRHSWSNKGAPSP